MRLIIRTDAEADIAQARGWYERQRVGLGAEFLEEISATIEAVHSVPLRFPATFRALRRALVHRFPCAIFLLSDPMRSSLLRLGISREICGVCIDV